MRVRASSSSTSAMSGSSAARDHARSASRQYVLGSPHAPPRLRLRRRRGVPRPLRHRRAFFHLSLAPRGPPAAAVGRHEPGKPAAPPRPPPPAVPLPPPPAAPPPPPAPPPPTVLRHPR